MSYVAKLLCPQCKSPYDSDDYQCTECELILNLDMDATATSAEPNIVQAFLSPPRRSAERPAPPQTRTRSDPDVTAPGAVVIDKDTIPRLVAGPELAMRPLHPFEAYVASFVNGINSAVQIAAAAEISPVEAMAVFRSLAQRKVVELSRQEPTMKAPPPAAPPRKPSGRGKELPSRPPPQWRPSSALSHDELSLERAVALERKGDVKGAVAVLKRAFGQVKRPAALFNKLALVVINQLKDGAQAEELLQQATELEPDNAVYQQNLATVRRRRPTKKA